MPSACCALPSDRQPKIQPAIATFSAGEFRRQPALSDNTAIIRKMNLVNVHFWTLLSPPIISMSTNLKFQFKFAFI